MRKHHQADSAGRALKLGYSPTLLFMLNSFESISRRAHAVSMTLSEVSGLPCSPPPDEHAENLEISGTRAPASSRSAAEHTPLYLPLPFSLSVPEV